MKKNNWGAREIYKIAYRAYRAERRGDCTVKVHHPIWEKAKQSLAVSRAFDTKIYPTYFIVRFLEQTIEQKYIYLPERTFLKD